MLLGGLGLLAGMASFDHSSLYGFRPAWPMLAAYVAVVVAWAAYRVFRARDGTVLSKLTTFAALAVVYLMLLAAAFVFGGVGYLFDTAKSRARQSVCAVNMRELAQAMLLYAEDHNGTLPPATRWSATIASPTIRPRFGFICPSSLASPPDDQRWSDYAMNDALSGAKIGAIRHPTRAVLLFECDLGWNAVGSRAQLPRKPRHLGGDDYAFADGHASWHDRGRAEELAWGQIGGVP